jgi:uncharacterized protein (DUF1501 family)
MSTYDLSRREFIRRAACSAVGYGAMYATVFDLHKVNAAAQTTGDYRALVCVFLYGGNDANNVLVPRDPGAHAQYAVSRGPIALPLTSLLPINAVAGDGSALGMHANLPELQGLYNSGRLAIVANVGPLVAPLTRQQYISRTIEVPPQLFSHSDQQILWQTSIADASSPTGWGGRTADLLRSLNGNSSVSMSISLGGTNTFQVGRDVFQYQVTTSGARALSRYAPPPSTDPESRAIDQLLAREHSNVFENAYRDTVRTAIDNERRVREALAAAPAFATVFPDSTLGRQLNMAARMIAARASLGQRRQIFFCAAGGYDTHGNQIGDQANLLRELSQALNAFYASTVELGVSDSVTAFTASDFGRTYASNGAGSDHGWGNHHFVVGGVVQGGRTYGRFPTLAINGPDDTGQGRWIPTTSVEEYSATLARWFGVSASDLHLVFPNLGRFNSPNLGFLG